MNKKNLFLLLKYDIKNGIIKRWKYFVLGVFLFLFVFLCFLLTYRNMSETYFDKNNFGIVDIVLTFFNGNKPLSADIHNQIELSIPWVCFHALLLLLTGFYADEDLKKNSQLYLIRVKSKNVWLVSKTIWCFFTVYIYYTVFFLTALFFVFCFGNINCLYNEPILTACFNLNVTNISPNEILSSVFIKPFIISCLFSEMEMIVSLFFKPIYVYLAFFSYIIISACYCSPFLIYNYSIVCRVSSLASFNVNWISQVFAMALIVMSVFICGIIKIKKKDIM